MNRQSPSVAAYLMHMKLRNSVPFATAALTIAAIVWASNCATAAEKTSIDPTGTWKLAMINPETKAKSGESTLKLKLVSGKLTGTIDGFSSHNGKKKIFEWPIKDSKLLGDEISFTVTHAPVYGNGPDSTTVYHSKITGETMKGTAETEWSGNTFKRAFEARRVKE